MAQTQGDKRAAEISMIEMTSASGSGGTVPVGSEEVPQEQLQDDERSAAQAQSDDQDDIEYFTGPKLYLSVAALYISLFLNGIDLTIVAVAIPSLTNHFHTVRDIGWYSAAYALVAGAFLFFFGKAATLFPTKSLILAGLAVFTIGSTICTFANSSEMFILGRAVAGFGISCFASGSMAILSHLFPKHKRSLWLSLAGTSQSLGLVTAPIIGGVLIDTFSWRACFGINIPLCPLCMVSLYFFLEDPVKNPDIDLPLKEKLKRLDPFGTLLVVPAIVSLLTALQWGGVRYGWSDARIVALFCVFAVSFPSFLYWQYRNGDKATLPLRILRRRGILAAAWFTACGNGILATTEFYISIYWQGVRGTSATTGGLLGLSMIIGILVASLIAGPGTNLIGYFTPFMLATSIFAPIFSGLLTTIDIDENKAKIVAYLGLLGLSVGIGLIGPMQAASFLLKPNEVSIGNAITGFGGAMGSAVFLSVSATLFQKRLAVEVTKHAPGTNVTALTHAGLSDLRNIIGQQNLKTVLSGYDKAIDQTLYLPLALSCATILGSALMEWPNVKKKKE